MKQIKDPIYGYVDVDDFCLPLIDSAEFQRLRNIVQTGYQALYPSALHNRFVRSIIGVPFVGPDKLLANTIIGMLNGPLIDVDKLDYLIRDSYVTGFNTMALDVDRLFAGYLISEYTDESFTTKCMVFKEYRL